MLTMTHYIQPVLTPANELEFHLEHWVSPTRGQHAVKTSAAFEWWQAESEITRLVILVGSPCTCGLSPGQTRTGPGRSPQAPARRRR